MTEGNTSASLHNDSWDRIEELLRNSDKKADSIIANNVEMQTS